MTTFFGGETPATGAITDYVVSVNSEDGVVTITPGDIEYDVSEDYTDGTLGAAVQDGLTPSNVLALWVQAGGTTTTPDIVRRVTVTDADYTLILADLANSSPSSPTWIFYSSATPRALTLPTQAAIPHPLMATVFLVQTGAGSITLGGSAGVGLNSAKGKTTAGKDSVVMIVSTFTDKFSLSGDLIAGGSPQALIPNSVNSSPIVGATLTLTPAVFFPDGAHTQQWLREHLTTHALTNIGAGGLTYVTVSGDIGFDVWCRETVTITGFAPIDVNSNKQTIVAAAVATPQKSTEPSFLQTSSNVVGGAVTVDAGNYTNSPTYYKFQLKKNGVNSGGVTNQAGRTLAYTMISGDEGKTLTYTVIAGNGSGDSADTGTTPVGWLVAAAVPAWTTLPAITVQGGGSSVAGCTLVCSDGVTNPTSTARARLWQFVDTITAGGPYAGDIVPSQTGSTYVTSNADIDSKINCRVTPSNASGPGAAVTALGFTITAAAPAPPPPPPPPSPSTNAGPRVVSFTNSGPITATTGQVITGLRITTAPCITIPNGVQNVIIQDCDLSGSGGEGVIIDEGVGTTIQFNNIHDGARGVLCSGATSPTVYKNIFNQFSAVFPKGTAAEFDFCNGATCTYNEFTGTNYGSDTVSFFQSSFSELAYNHLNVDMGEPSAAGFTMGDMIPVNQGGSGDPGHDNYVHHNTVLQTNGVPAGVFGSSGNTILEFNCFTAGIQAYNYSGVFTGVTVRKNVINLGNSFVPVTSILAGWNTNIDSTNCNLVPTS